MDMASTQAQGDAWTVGGVTLGSRFLLGTARYPEPRALADAIAASGAEVLTVGLKRSLEPENTAFMAVVRQALAGSGVRLLPNTAGCYTAREAVQVSHMARELYGTSWIKLEVLGDRQTLQPDMFETVAAAQELVREGFTLFPYCTDDLIGCRRLLDAGCPVLMPWGAPIGSGQGLVNPFALRTLRESLPDATLIVDAGLGAPSHAARVMELGFDAVLLNTAVAQSGDPVAMARAFRLAIEGGRLARHAGVIAARDFAVPSTPVGEQPVLGGKP